MSEVSTWQLAARFGLGGKITQAIGGGGIYSSFCSRPLYLFRTRGVGAALEVVFPNVCEDFPDPLEPMLCEFHPGNMVRMKTVTVVFFEITWVKWRLYPGGDKKSWHPAFGLGLGYFDLEWRVG